MRRHVVVRDTLYKIRFHFWRGPERAMVEHTKKDGYPECEEHNGAARCISYTSPGYGQLVIHLWVSPAHKLTDPFGASCVSHEAIHAALEVWKRIGQPAPDAEHAEAFAYYVEWIVREFLRRMR